MRCASAGWTALIDDQALLAAEGTPRARLKVYLLTLLIIRVNLFMLVVFMPLVMKFILYILVLMFMAGLVTCADLRIKRLSPHAQRATCCLLVLMLFVCVGDTIHLLFACVGDIIRLQGRVDSAGVLQSGQQWSLQVAISGACV